VRRAGQNFHRLVKEFGPANENDPTRMRGDRRI
jgi:hypothetical protein